MTSTRVQIRRDTAANILLATPAEGELGYDITNRRLLVGDGSQQGGIWLPSYRDIQNSSFVGAVAGGTANALTISTARNPSTLIDLQSVRVKITTTNTGSATLQWGGLPATPIKKYSGTSKVDMAAGNLIAGKIYHFDFDGTDFVLFAEGGGGVPAGAVVEWAGINAPTGWLMCYGQAVSRITYADLYAAIGATYGAGDGSTTFNVPDDRGIVIAGRDDMGGTAAGRLTGFAGSVNGTVLGARGGAETCTLTTTQMPSHAHSFTWENYNIDYTATTIATANKGQNTSSKNTGNTGGGAAHNNVQPTGIRNKIIKT